MKYGITTILCLFACLIIGSTILAAEKANNKIDDQDMANAIYAALFADQAVASHLIDISVSEGVVKLSGSVDNILAKDRAVQLAEMTKGVRAVVNLIKVKPVDKKDKSIRHDVETALLRDPATDSYELNVFVDGGVVTLTGEVDSLAEKNLCETVTKGVIGVKEVINRITYTRKGDRPDHEIKAEIEKRLFADTRINDSLIEVTVNNGNVTLGGVVGSAWEKTLAWHESFIAGVDSVDLSKLKVRWWAKDLMSRKLEPAFKTDEELKHAIEDALQYDPRVQPFTIDVGVKDGKATLNGVVDNLKAKRAAVLDAQNTAGVLRVLDYLVVRPVLRPDKELAKDIREALLRDPYVNRFEIDVIVINSKAYLFGNVANNFEKRHAEDVTSRVKGVVDVQNNISAADNTPQKKNDWELAEDIESQLWWSPAIDEEFITVSVDDGVVTLNGVVEDLHEFRTAEENVIAAGAKRVINKLKIGFAPSANFPSRPEM